MALDRFSWGAILIALVLEGFIVYGWATSEQDQEGEEARLWRLGFASLFPLVLVLVTLLVHRLQRQ